MSTYRLGPKASLDLEEVFDYTVDTWGGQQAEDYVEELAQCFQMLADSPGLGRACDLLFPGIRRFEQGRHVIFYKPDRSGILISRILHQSRLPTRPHFLGA